LNNVTRAANTTKETHLKQLHLRLLK